MVIFHRRLSSTKGRLPKKVVSQQKIVFHRRLSSTYHNTLVDLIFVRTVNIPNLSLLPCLEVVFHRRSSSTYHNTLVYIIFMRTVSIPNLNFFLTHITHTQTEKAIYCCLIITAKLTVENICGYIINGRTTVRYFT